MSHKKDLTGIRVGRLVAIRPVYTDAGRRWECRCDCGETVFLRTPRLTGKNKTNSCGCLWKETVPGSRRTHGQSETALYRIWTLMLDRCYNAKGRAYRHYGGRGIAVCERWKHSFENFRDDMGDRPGKEFSLDRIDNDGSYSPENCRWATRYQQANNCRKNHVLTFQDTHHTISEWARIFGMSPGTLYNRITALKWPVERALTTPVRQHKRYA